MFRDELQRMITNCDGALAGVVMGFDGIAVDAVVGDPGFDVNTIAMEYSFVLTQVRKAADILDAGSLNEVSIRCDELTFVVRVLSREYFVALALRPGGNLGKGRYLMRRALPELRGYL